MKIVIILLIFMASTLLQAEVITSKVHSIENGFIKFENGRVAFLDQKNFKLIPGDVIEAKVNENLSLLSIKKISHKSPSHLKYKVLLRNETTPPSFEPTVVPNMQEAWKIFNRSNPNYKRISECSDRAHIWAHDEFKLSGTKSKKVFVFFTASYINSVRFKWWFHVAPLYSVKDSGEVKELVMDYRYTNRPMTIKEWTDHFVYTKRSCKVTMKFSEYDVNPQTENCYLITESMHYKIPGEIQAQELHGFYKATTSESELKLAFNLGFIKKEQE